MARQRYTLANLEARLTERLGPNEKFWGDHQERKDALNEAISVWQALTGEWTTQISISGKSKNRNFYPTPRQIVSLTRVSIAGFNEASTIESLIAHIIPNSDMRIEFTSAPPPDLWTYWIDPGQTIDWNIIPSGGQEPYSYQWYFEQHFRIAMPGGGGVDGYLPPSDAFMSTDESPVTFFDPALVTDADWRARCVVTDSVGDSYTATFPFKVTVTPPFVFTGTIRWAHGGG